MSESAEVAAEWIKGRVNGHKFPTPRERIKKLQDENDVLVERVQHLATQHQGSFDTIKRQRKLISHFKSCLKLWMPRGAEKHERTVGEMKDVQDKIERELNG